METSTVLIRGILPRDNAEVAQVFLAVLVEMGVPKVGTAYAGMALDHMYENYDVPRADYIFEYIDAPMGNTGHFSCPVWMLKSIR